jgi:hypothetical protein
MKYMEEKYYIFYMHNFYINKKGKNGIDAEHVPICSVVPGRLTLYNSTVFTY